jgi:8-oxo-dGTP diphosphatase
MSASSSASVRVVAGALFDAQGRVLIARRPPGKHMAGSWEFPGGKLAAGESAEAALARELAEELGVTLQRCRPLLDLTHDYPDRRIELAMFIVEVYRGEPVALEGQALKWVPLTRLSAQNLLPADRPIVESLIAQLSNEGRPNGPRNRNARDSAR